MSKCQESMLHISRADGKPITGWMVRFYQGRTLIASRNFTDSAYQGKDGARIAAIKWRNRKLKELSVTHGLSSKNVATHVSDVRNTSGVVGVNLTRQGNRPFWCSRVGRGVRKIFYIRRRGYVAAFQAACKHRAEFGGVVIEAGIKPPPPPQWLIDLAAKYNFKL